MANLVERARTMARWIRFLSLNHPPGNWGEPAPPPATFPCAPLLPSPAPPRPFDPLLSATTLSYVEGLNARVSSFDDATRCGWKYRVILALWFPRAASETELNN
jgi:hypothetical protein